MVFSFLTTLRNIGVCPYSVVFNLEKHRGESMKVKSVFQGDLTNKQQKAIELLAKAIREGRL